MKRNPIHETARLLGVKLYMDDYVELIGILQKTGAHVRVTADGYELESPDELAKWTRAGVKVIHIVTSPDLMTEVGHAKERISLAIASSETSVSLVSDLDERGRVGFEVLEFFRQHRSVLSATSVKLRTIWPISAILRNVGFAVLNRSRPRTILGIEREKFLLAVIAGLVALLAATLRIFIH